jgi:RND family efflux transporter MFP subunit
MKNKWIKFLLPIVVLGVFVIGFMVINATAEIEAEKDKVDTRPTVKIQTMIAEDHQIVITSYGEIKPLEITELATQVSGEVIHWNPKFIAGGFVKRGEILFSIEPDNYQASVLEGEAAVARAQAALIQEKANAHVAREEASRIQNSKPSDLYLRKPQLLSANAELKSAEALLKRAERDLANCDVRAPYDALIISRNIGLGQFVNVGSPVAILNNIETAEVTVPVAGFDSTFLPERVSGLAANVIQKGVNSFSRAGVISRDLGIVDSETRMSNIVVRITDPYGLNSDVPPLKFGSYVEVNFDGQTLKNIYRLSQELVHNSTVWIVNENNKLESRKVSVNKAVGEFFLVSEGLYGQEQLVVTLPEYPKEGQEVKIAATKPEAESDDKNNTANALTSL